MSQAIKAIPRALIALAIFVAAAYAMIAIYNAGAEDGYKSGAEAIGSYVALDEQGQLHHNSPAYSPSGDFSGMGSYRCTADDRSFNLQESLSVCVNGAWTRFKYVSDTNGVWNGSVTQSMGFPGRYHYGCTQYGGQCGSANRH